MIQEKEKNKNRGCFTYSLIIMIVISVIYLITSVMNFSNKNAVEYSYSDFLQLVEDKTIKEACILDKSTITGRFLAENGQLQSYVVEIPYEDSTLI